MSPSPAPKPKPAPADAEAFRRLQHAIDAKDIAAVAALVARHGPGILHEQTHQTRAAAGRACARGDAALIEVVLRLGGDPYAIASNHTPIPGPHYLAATGHLDGLKVMLTFGVDFDLPDPYGNRPLHWACSNGNREAVYWLLAQGVDPIAPDGELSTPAQVAADTGHADLAEALRARVREQGLSRPRAAPSLSPGTEPAPSL